MASEARFIRADRSQTKWDFVELDAVIASDHRARVVMGCRKPQFAALCVHQGARRRADGHPHPPCWRCGFATIESGRGSAAGSTIGLPLIAGGVPLHHLAVSG
jgi:hypothetical protein